MPLTPPSLHVLFCHRISIIDRFNSELLYCVAQNQSSTVQIGASWPSGDQSTSCLVNVSGRLVIQPISSRLANGSFVSAENSMGQNVISRNQVYFLRGGDFDQSAAQMHNAQQCCVACTMQQLLYCGSKTLAWTRLPCLHKFKLCKHDRCAYAAYQLWCFQQPPRKCLARGSSTTSPSSISLCNLCFAGRCHE